MGQEHILRLQNTPIVEFDVCKRIQTFEHKDGLGPVLYLWSSNGGSVGPFPFGNPLDIELVKANKRIGYANRVSWTSTLGRGRSWHR
jgi:hypothetical protein